MRRTLLTIGIDWALLAGAFLAVHALNYGYMEISEANWRVFQLQILTWLAVSVAMKKFTRNWGEAFKEDAGLLLMAGVAMLFLLSLLIVGFQQMHFSRIMAYGTVATFVCIELLLLPLFTRTWKTALTPSRPSWKPVLSRFSRPLFVLDGTMIIAAFFIAAFLKRGSLELYVPYNDVLLLVLGLWLATSLITRKFNKDNFNDFFNAIGPALKTAVFIAAGLAFFIYILRLAPISRFQVFGPLIIFFVMELIVFALYVNYRKHGGAAGDIESPEHVKKKLDAEKDSSALEPSPASEVIDPVKDKLKQALDFFDPTIFDMLQSNVALDHIDRKDCALMSTDNMFNLDVLENGCTRLIINLHKINDIRWFNRYFLLVHEKLGTGGYFMGKAHTISTQREYFKDKYSGQMAAFFYVLSFVWRRLFPKLPWLQKFYFALTGGRGRMVSRAEILGRLSFCGFKIIAEEELGHRFFFIVQKARMPCTDERPTYGPLVRLNRSGLTGRPIKVYKFRTMYPFSEYLQEYVYERNSLDKNGKFKDDFRVTGWGRFMRRTWIDELPMLYNWLRGDLHLVGVRPLSSQYLKLYAPELRELRQRVKPGLLPPFYADMPTNLQDIMDSERRYIEACLKNPVRTQVRYFFKCTWNIVIRGSRSQ